MSRHLTVDGLPTSERTLQAHKRELRELLESAKARDLQAATSLLRQIAMVDAKLEHVKAAKGVGKAAKMSEEDLVNAIRREAERMPDGHLRVVVDVYLARRGFELVPVEG